MIKLTTKNIDILTFIEQIPISKLKKKRMLTNAKFYI